MRFDHSFLDEIRARLPVSQIVSRHVKIQRYGREFKGLSPFKAEKTPSFTVNDQKGFYHCFSSGEHGDIFTFLMKMEGISFPEAVERLAHEAGLEMPKLSPRSEEQKNQKERLLELMDSACTFFEQQLNSAEGGPARSYLDDRAVSRDLREIFRIGFAPENRSALKEHLAGKGFSHEEMSLAGVLITGEDIPVSYDRFRNRIIFPIMDLKNRVMAFGGRALDQNQPAKYLNSPETPLFHKGWVLFNASLARQAAYDKGEVIAVEGYMDVIALTGAGIANAVAPLGTALTEHQLKLLWRMAPEPVLSFDGDEAGRKAAHRALETALPHLKPGYSLRFAFMPEGQDPDDLIQNEGPEAVRDIIAKSMPLADVLWRKEWEAGQWNTPERRAAFEHRIRQLVSEIQDPLVRSHYQDDLKMRLQEKWKGGGAQSKRWSQVKGGRGTLHAGHIYPGKGTGAFLGSTDPASESLKNSNLVKNHQGRFPPREAILIKTVLNHPWLIEEFSEEIASIEFESKALSELRKVILKLHILQNSLDREGLDTQLRQMGQDNILDQLARAITHKSVIFALPEASEKEARAGWSHILALHRKMLDLKRELVNAERAWDQDMTEENWVRLSEIRNQISDKEGTEASIEGFGEPHSKQSVGRFNERID